MKREVKNCPDFQLRGRYMAGSIIAEDKSKIACFGNFIWLQRRQYIFGFPLVQNVEENSGIFDKMLADV